MARRKHGKCGLCGDETFVTRDHFTPRGLWSGPRPADTLTIPICDGCNDGTNLDDEYFRNALVMMYDLDHPEKVALFNGPVLRSYKKHSNWIRNNLSRARIRSEWSPSGLWIGTRPVLPLDRERFDRSLR